MESKILKTIKAIKLSHRNNEIVPIFETISLCHYENCKRIAFKKCPKIGSRQICRNHCFKLCDLGINKTCDLLKLYNNIKSFYKDIENFLNEKKAKNLIDFIVEFLYNSLTLMNLWHYQINPKIHDSSLICVEFEAFFNKASKNKVISSLIDFDLKKFSLLCNYLVKIDVLNNMEYQIQKFLIDNNIDYQNFKLSEIESQITQNFPNIIDIKECPDTENAILLFLKNIYPLSKICNYFSQESFINKVQWRKKLCYEKIKKGECLEECRRFVDSMNSIESITNLLLLFFLSIIKQTKNDLLNLGVIHIYFEQSGYGASFIYDKPLNFEKSQNCIKIINPILLLDKKLFRNLLLPYSSSSLTGKTPQEPFLTINRVFIDNKWREIILRHYYSGIYIPIDIHKFFESSELISDIFKAVSYIQDNHPYDISQATAANIIPKEFFKKKKIVNAFKEMGLNDLLIRDLGGGRGEMTIEILKQLYRQFKDIKLKKISIIDMDINLEIKVKANFVKLIESQGLDNSILNSLEVRGKKNFFKEIDNINERVTLTIISQVLDMYILIESKIELKSYTFSLRHVFKIIKDTLIKESIKLFKEKDIKLGEILDRIKLKYRTELNNKTHLTDFVLSPYYAAIWQSRCFNTSNYHPTLRNIGYSRSNKFPGNIYIFLKKVFELSDYILIIDRGISKETLKYYFNSYDILFEQVPIKTPFMNINVLILKKK